MDQIQSFNEVYKNGDVENYLTPNAIHEALIPNKEQDFDGALNLAERLQLDILDLLYPDAIVDYTPYRDWRMVRDELFKKFDNCNGFALDPDTDQLFLLEKYDTGIDVLAIYEVFSEHDVNIDLPELLTELNAHERMEDLRSREASTEVSEEIER